MAIIGSPSAETRAHQAVLGCRGDVTSRDGLVRARHETREARARVDREKLRQIDLHWHDLRHEGACRLLADGVDIRIIQLMLGHSDIKTTQRYLNITDEELRKVLTGVWERRRQLKAVGE
jgi:site-specific recombinase XerD